MIPQGRLMLQREAAMQLFQQRTWAAVRARLSAVDPDKVSSVGPLLQSFDVAGSSTKREMVQQS